MPACIWSDLERISGKPMGQYTLLNLCLDVHKRCSGSPDVFPVSLLGEAVRVLEKADKFWYPSSDQKFEFDSVVLALVRTAAGEGKAELQRLSEPLEADKGDKYEP